MLGTIAYCLGFTTNRAPFVEENCPTYTIQETEDQWNLVDINNFETADGNEEGDFLPPLTPPPSPNLEQSWLVTPPPCFDAENNGVIEQFSQRENLLIEHPSMFVRLPSPQEKDAPTSNEEELSNAIRQHKRIPTSLRRCQKRPIRQAPSTLSLQNRRNRQLKHSRCDALRRNNKGFKKMRQLVQQPRKRC